MARNRQDVGGNRATPAIRASYTTGAESASPAQGYGRAAGRCLKPLKQFGLANSIDCRDENNLLVGEMTNWRVQKVSIK